MFEVTVTNNRASTKRGELLTEGQVGAKVHFSFNDHWTNMKKTAVFKRCGKTIVLTDTEWDGDTVPVPPEMTEKAGQLVHVGVYGVSEDGRQITPTLYAPLGVVAKGAKPDGDPSTDPTLPVWAQIQGDLDNVRDELNDVAAKAVQADWNQNDPEQPDYVKHRTHSANPKYVFVGNTFSEWSEFTQYAQRPIPKVVVQGVEYFNVNVTKIENPLTPETEYIYQLSDTVKVTVYFRQAYIAPTMNMYSYDPGINEIGRDYIPQHVDWIAGDTTAGAYIANRSGGYIEPSDEAIGAIIRIAQNTSWPAYADRVSWNGTEPKDTDAVRISGMYLDGTFFDACCLYGALAKTPDVKSYGINPFRFKMIDRTNKFIDMNVVSYATIYSATLYKHPEWTLPLFTDEPSPVWALMHDASIQIDNNAVGYSGLARNDNGTFFSRDQCRIYTDITDMRTIYTQRADSFQINGDPNRYLTELFALDFTPQFPIRGVVRKDPSDGVMTMGLDFEDTAGFRWYTLGSVYDTKHLQSVTVLRRPYVRLTMTFTEERDQMTCGFTRKELRDAASSLVGPYIIDANELVLLRGDMNGDPFAIGIMDPDKSTETEQACAMYVYSDEGSDNDLVTWICTGYTMLPYTQRTST